MHAQPEALAEGVGELVVDEGLGRAGPPVAVHLVEEGGGLAGHGQVGEGDRRFDDRQVVEDPVRPRAG